MTQGQVARYSANNLQRQASVAHTHPTNHFTELCAGIVVTQQSPNRRCWTVAMRVRKRG